MANPMATHAVDGGIAAVPKDWQANALQCWAAVGALCVVFIAWILARWVLSDSFVPTDPGPDPLPAHVKWAISIAQVLGPLVWGWILWRWLIAPWRRAGRLTIEGALVIAWTFAYFLDPTMSYTVNHLTYNAYLVNFGSWTTGIWPGWTAPNTNYLAEPLVVGFTAYVYASFVPAVFVCWALRRARARWPGMGMLGGLSVALFALMLIDLLIEGTMVRLQLENYAGAIRSLSLWGGEWYQFPLYESVLWGLNVMGTMLLLFFRDDRGRTFIERGTERLKVSRGAVDAMRLLAAIGFVQVWMILTWTIPMNWFGTHADPFPEDLPSYLRNNMCGDGTPYPCPGSGIPFPRAH